MSVLGVDVASHQGHVSWPDVAASGHAFGWTKATGGAWYTNPTFAANWHGIKAAGLQRGAYAYAFESSGQPFPGPGPEVEAQFFLDTVVAQGLGPTDMLALDIEEGPADIDLSDWALRWLRYVEQSVGFRPLCYTGRWFTEQHDFWARSELATYPLWVAAYQQAMPAPPAPWERVVFWQQTDRASVPGIATPCDLNLFNGAIELLTAYGMPADSAPVEPTVPPQTPELPRYDPLTPQQQQDDQWSCSCVSTWWGMTSYGRRPSEPWVENQMVADGIVSYDLGLLNATGAGLARWITDTWGEFGYSAQNMSVATWDDVKAVAGQVPVLLGGRRWGAGGHWTGVRSYDAARDRLEVANPSVGYGGVGTTMTHQQFSDVGPCSMVVIHHVGELQPSPVPPEPAPPDPAHDYGVGSGLVQMMAEDNTTPAAPSSWLPLGASPSLIEEAVGLNGTTYRWHLPTGSHWRYRPS